MLPGQPCAQIWKIISYGNLTTTDNLPHVGHRSSSSVISKDGKPKQFSGPREVAVVPPRIYRSHFVLDVSSLPFLPALIVAKTRYPDVVLSNL